MNLNDIKSYLRITHNADDGYLTKLIETAKQLVEEKTGVKYEPSNLLYEQALRYAVQHFYDNRIALSDKNLIDVPYTLNELICHIGIKGITQNEQRLVQTPYNGF